MTGKAAVASAAKALAYRVLDVCTGGAGIPRRIEGEWIRFPARWCRYYSGEYEPATFAFLRDRLRPGNTALDVGAHIGLFSVLMARLVAPAGRVISFEPTPSTRRVLAETVRLNGCGEYVQIRAEAMSAVSGSAPFRSSMVPGCNSNSLVGASDEHGAIQVPTISLDELVDRERLSVSLIKIDVEGAELHVLRGAARTLAQQRPAVSLALHPLGIRAAGGSLNEIWQLLAECRLGVFHQGSAVAPDWFLSQSGLFDVQLLPAHN